MILKRDNFEIVPYYIHYGSFSGAIMYVIQVQFKWLAFDRIRNILSMVIVQKAECRNIYRLREVWG